MIRWVAVLFAAGALAIIGMALASVATFGLTRNETIVLGTGPAVLSLVVAVCAHRGRTPSGLQRLVFAQILAASVAASLGVGLAGDAQTSVLLAVVVVLAYSGIVLAPRRHAVVTVTAIVLSSGSAALAGGLGAPVLTALAVVAITGVLTGLGARLHTVELHDREDAIAAANRSARALDAAVEGILEATSTDPDEIVDAVVGAAGRLVEGPAMIYLLGEDGMAHPRASHALPEGFEELPLPPTFGLVGHILKLGRPVDMHADEADELSRMHRLLGLETLIGAPIRVGDVVMGVLVGGREDAEDWTAEERGTFALLAQHTGRALELSDEAAADRRMLARMAELDRIKDEIVTTVSHELRTPVTVIAGLAETLARRQDLAPDMRNELVQRLWANGVSLAQIVEQLLDAALLQRGELEPTIQDVSVDRVVRRTTTRLWPLLSDHTMHVEVPEDLSVLADPLLIERVVDNVVLNALRHTPPGTTVRVSATRLGDHVEIAVEDDGPGIAGDDIDRILERFERAGAPGERSRGMGIGLSLASEILRVHGSRMEVTSRPGEGARFAFVLPTGSTEDTPARRVSR